MLTHSTAVHGPARTAARAPPEQVAAGPPRRPGSSSSGRRRRRSRPAPPSARYGRRVHGAHRAARARLRRPRSHRCDRGRGVEGAVGGCTSAARRHCKGFRQLSRTDRTGPPLTANPTPTPPASPPVTRPPTSPCPPTPASRSRSSALRGRKVIVYFYPAAMTPGCTKQACDFRDSLDSLQAAGLRGGRHLPGQAGQAGEVPRARRPHVPLVSDEDRSVLTAYGAFGEKKLYGKVVQGVIRSTFVIDEDGRDRARAVQRQGDRPRRQAAQGPRSGLSDHRKTLDWPARARSPTGRGIRFRS